MDGYRPSVLVLLAVLLCGLIAGCAAGFVLGYFVVSPWLRSGETYSGGHDEFTAFAHAVFCAYIAAPIGAAGAFFWMVREVRRHQL
jgi:hypothetical protein